MKLKRNQIVGNIQFVVESNFRSGDASSVRDILSKIMLDNPISTVDMVRMFITQVTNLNPSAVYIPVRPMSSSDLYELYHNIKLEAIQNGKTYY